MRFLDALLLNFSLFASIITASLQNLTIRTPQHIPALPASTVAILTNLDKTLRARVRRDNSFVFYSDSLIDGKVAGLKSKSYLLDIACRDWDFGSYGLDVFFGGEKDNGNEVEKMEVYRVQRGGIEIGGREEVGVEGVEVRVLRGRDYYEVREGFSPLSLLKNPMILIAIVGLAFVFGMPYLMDNMDPEMRKEFEEQQKKGILSGGASTTNPLQNFDMAAWMAGKTAGASGRDEGEEDVESTKGVGKAGTGGGGGNGGGKGRRRG